MSRSSTNAKAAALATGFTVVFIVAIPLALLSAAGPLLEIRLGRGAPLALLFVLPGAWIAISCVMRFASEGQGTPAPFDPPRRVVARGFYRRVRNPMYIGVFLIVAGEAVLFSSGAIFAYLLILMAVAHLFVVFYEEPTLRRRFGAEYSRYCRRVDRWIPDLSRHRRPGGR